MVGNSLSTVFGIYCVEPLLVDEYILKMVMSIFFNHTVAIYVFIVALEDNFIIKNHLNINAFGTKNVATGCIWQCLIKRKCCNPLLQ